MIHDLYQSEIQNISQHNGQIDHNSHWWLINKNSGGVRTTCWLQEFDSIAHDLGVFFYSFCSITEPRLKDLNPGSAKIVETGTDNELPSQIWILHPVTLCREFSIARNWESYFAGPVDARRWLLPSQVLNSAAALSNNSQTRCFWPPLKSAGPTSFWILW
jgi:hypothetical protein